MSGPELNPTTTLDAATLAAYNAAAAESGGEIRTYDELVAEFGQENVDNAFFNYNAQSTADAMKAQIDIRFPGEENEAARESAYAVIDDSMPEQRPTTADAQSAVDEIWGNIMDVANEEMAEEAAGAANTRAGERGGNNGAGNWLVLMAKVMAESAGDHLAKALQHAHQIGSLTDEAGLRGIEGFERRETGEGEEAESFEEAQARATVLLQAKMQAETQLFKMVFEAGSTLIKTAGESFSTMARRQ